LTGAIADVADLIRGRRAIVLAGAGCSTESGIPDYRGSSARLRARSPIQYGEFIGRAAARQRYWARSVIGWPRLATARPNPAHLALAHLEAAGAATGVITQNVDGLHHAAGSRRVVELHGSLTGVRCLDCYQVVARADLQHRLVADNAAWLDQLRGEADSSPAAAWVYQRRSGVVAAPDGDADLIDRHVPGFRVPDCEACGGILKPDVVLFGENVPRDRLGEAWRLFDDGDVLLVVGSSLAVFSGRRFMYRAIERRVPIAVVNLGATRADGAAAAKVEARLGDALPELVRALRPAAESAPVRSGAPA
jgi:NAD+-dependent protein deacetylase sirtuin 4